MGFIIENEFVIGFFLILFAFNYISGILLYLESDIPPTPELISITWEQSGKKSTLRWMLFYYYPYVWKVCYKTVIKMGASSIIGSLVLSYYMQESELGRQLAMNTGNFVLNLIKN
jgi:hypothetical protein